MHRLCLALMIAAVLPAAAEPLAPGKPAGVKQAQLGDFTAIYGGVLLFGALLYAVIGTTGDPASSTTSTN